MFKCTLDQPESGFISTIAFETNVKKVISGMRNEPYLSDGVHVYQTQPDGSLQAQNAIMRVPYARWPQIFTCLGLEPNKKEFIYLFMNYTDPDYFSRGIIKELHLSPRKSRKRRGVKYIFGLLMSKPMRAEMTSKRGYQNLFELCMVSWRSTASFQRDNTLRRILSAAWSKLSSNSQQFDVIE